MYKTTEYESAGADGTCRSGALVRAYPFRAATANMAYRWQAVWCYEGTARFHENGQLSSCQLARSALGLAPDRKLCGDWMQLSLTPDGIAEQCYARLVRGSGWESDAGAIEAFRAKLRSNTPNPSW